MFRDDLVVRIYSTIVLESILGLPSTDVLYKSTVYLVLTGVDEKQSSSERAGLEPSIPMQEFHQMM